MSESSIQKKLETFQNLISHAGEVMKEFENGMNLIDGQFQDLKSSGNWNDPHTSRFETERLSPYKMRIHSINNSLKEVQNFLGHKYETLKTHGQ